jgi:replicative DNA helicase Mcm
MNPEDRSAMHGALEQNIVSINKANIHVDLPAKTTVIAAANPILGQYDVSKTIVENVKMLSVPLLTRFDLIFIVKDVPDRKRDTSIFRHLRDAKKAETVDRDFLKKFIIYAKSLTPEIDDDAFDYLEKFYVEARSHNDPTKVPITPRHRDALIRLSEAHAKLFLKGKVDLDDAKAAVDILNASLEEVGDVGKMAETKGDKKLLIIKFLKDEGPLEECDLKDHALTQMTNEEFVKFIIDLENCGAIVKLSSSPLTYGLPNQKARIDSY